MSETTPSASDALPLIRNASPLRLKLIAMQPGETMDIAKAELPCSYKDIQALLTNIRKGYGRFYKVLNTGKDVYLTTNEPKYNNYLIYS